MADPMRIRANNKDGVTEVRVLMSHVMESGARKDAAGATIPAHYIKDLKPPTTAKWCCRPCSAVPCRKTLFLSFKFRGGAKGRRSHREMGGQQGDTCTDKATIA